METDDAELLREFVATRSHDAFADLVRRYVDMVYSAAWRQVGNAARAQDVTQEVFIILAAKAGRIHQGEALAGWLLMTTRFVVLNVRRHEGRRSFHEREAATMRPESHSNPSPDTWEAIAPLLDEAIARLKRDDRDALAMRYFQGRNFDEIAAALQISPQAAQKRLSRAIEQLRRFFADRGIAAPSQVVASLLVTNAVIAAPTALGAAISSAAVAHAAAAGSSWILGKGAFALMTAKAKAAAAVGLVLLAGTAGTIAYNQIGGPNEPRRVQVAAAAAPVAGSDGNWEARFREHYGLADGEILKRVPRPFIPQRLDYYKARMHPAQVKAQPDGPDAFILTDDGKELNFHGAMYAGGFGGDVRTALEMVAEIQPQEMRIPSKLLDSRLPGDWVFRAGATQTQRIDALSQRIAKETGQAGAFVQRPIEREAIVVTGTFAYKPIAGAKANPTGRPMGPNPVYFFRGSLEQSRPRAGGTSSVQGMLDCLANFTRLPVIVEAKVDDVAADGEPLIVSWQNCLPFDRAPAADGQNRAETDELLDNLARQTALRFERRKQPVPTWVWEPASN